MIPQDETKWARGFRTKLRPGDLGTIVHLHGIIYAKERGFDPTFEAYVAGPLAEFIVRQDARERLWIAELDKRIVGCVAIVAASARTAQLRWFLVDPLVRGKGLGGALLQEAIAFCRSCRFEEIVLWTESALTVAAELYGAAGFKKTGEVPGKRWGVELVEEKYVLRLTPS